MNDKEQIPESSSLINTVLGSLKGARDSFLDNADAFLMGLMSLNCDPDDPFDFGPTRYTGLSHAAGHYAAVASLPVVIPTAAVINIGRDASQYAQQTIRGAP